MLRRITRQMVWGLFVLLTVGSTSFEVFYVNGLHIRYIGWLELIADWWREG